MKPSVLSLYSPTHGVTPPSGHMFSHRSSHGGLPQLKKIDLTSARSQKQLTVKPSVLSLYSPTMGDSPSGHRFGYRFGHRSGYGELPPGPVTGSVTGPVMETPPFTSHYITSHVISTKAPFTGANKAEQGRSYFLLFTEAV